ncbi:MAG: hypothetical protein CMJ64_29060 [Planctomycetaceae bacterium]|nr:hypothetical protein [Planctomycetaceae bacterium]
MEQRIKRYELAAARIQMPGKSHGVLEVVFVVLFAGCLLAGCEANTSSDSVHEVAANSADGAIESEDAATKLPQPADGVGHDDWFEDITGQSGVDFTYRNGQESGNYSILESLGGGVAMLDYDRDDDLDLFFSGGGTVGNAADQIRGRPSALYRNDGDWSFVDVTKESGIGQSTAYTHGCAVGDFDCDGWPDLLVCGYGGCRLLQNMADGRFRDVTNMCGLMVSGEENDWNTTPAIADFDRDGTPDFYIVRYLDWSPESDVVCRDRQGRREVCSPGRFVGASDRLYQNLGNGRFEDVSADASLLPNGNGLGAVATDLNGDGWIDLYVANDESNNFLYLGQPDLKWQETGLAAGVATNEYGMHDGSMGVDAGDYDGDGEPDLWVTNFESEDNGLYRNLGDGTFTQTTTSTGLAGQSRGLVGFGTGLIDLDLDGWLDIFVVNGHVFYGGGQAHYLQPAQLFRNRKGRRFEDVSQAGGVYFRGKHAARGAAVGDLDNDGSADLVITHQNAPVTLLRNRRSPSAFLRVQLTGTQSDRQAVGAVVTTDFEGRPLVRFVRSGSGYFSHSDQRIIFPCSEESADVTVVWPRGQREVFRGLGLGVTHQLVEGRGES